MQTNNELDRTEHEVSYWREACCALQQADPTLGRLIRSCPGTLTRSSDTPFHSLCRSIVGQQLSVRAAKTVWTRLETRIGNITPDTIVTETTTSLHGCGLSRQKAYYLVCLAEHFNNGMLADMPWSHMQDKEVIAELVQIKGIGQWTAEMFLIFFLGRADILPLTDRGIQRSIAKLFNSGARLNDDAIEEIAEPWRPWRSVASWYLWQYLDTVPVQD